LVQESGIPFRHQIVLQDVLTEFPEFYLIACVVVMHITPLVPLIDKASPNIDIAGQLQREKQGIGWLFAVQRPGLTAAF
jgi:hypothetical protein